MNSSEMLVKISTDLNIKQFDDENKLDFGNRVIFSALVAWARIQVLGKSYTTVYEENQYMFHDEFHNVDVLHIHSRLIQVAKALISFIPHNNSWLLEKSLEQNASELSSLIIKELEDCFEYVTIKTKGTIDNERKRLTFSPPRSIAFENLTLLQGGATWDDNNIFNVGIGKWKNEFTDAIDYRIAFTIPKNSPKKYLEILARNMEWKSFENVKEYDVFIPGKSWLNYYSWENFENTTLKDGIYLIRSSANEKQHNHYSLFLKDSEGQKIAILNRWYDAEFEFNRIMFALNAINNKNNVFRAIIKKNYVELDCSSLLPRAEQKIMKLSSWPKRDYKDKHRRIVPIELWGIVKNMLLDLGIKIAEVENFEGKNGRTRN